jgi:hypothetical protein
MNQQNSLDWQGTMCYTVIINLKSIKKPRAGMNYSMFSNSIVAGTVKHSNSFSHMRSKSNLFEVIQKV